jgi:pyruvate,water dikinase
MRLNRLIYPLKRTLLPKSAGNKARNLQLLLRLGLELPKTYVCDWQAFNAYVGNKQTILVSLEKQIKQTIDLNKNYAVRSSASVEDGLVQSYAGQFESILNVKGLMEIMQAIQDVWSSATATNVQVYRDRHQIKSEKINMGVIIQEMVLPVYSGVALSKNPVTGGDEIVVEAVEGEGTLLMQDGIKPHRWINKWGYWIEQDEQKNIPLNLIDEIVRQVNNVVEKIGHPVDMEWVYDGDKLYWVQIREITSINKLNIYSNYLSREMMPGMLKPLSFTIGAHLMSNGLVRWLKEIMGNIDVEPQDMVKSFYYRVYFNMGSIGKIFEKFGFPKESLELMLGVLPANIKKPKIKPTFRTFLRFPGIFFYLLKNLRLKERIRAQIDSLEEKLQPIKGTQLEQLNAEEQLVIIKKHKEIAENIGYFTSLSMFILSMYSRALKRLLNKQGIDISDFDVTENMPELEVYYPSVLIKELNEIYSSYPVNKQERISSSRFDELYKIEGIDVFLEMFESLLNRFGHLGDCGNDFSQPPWRETPDVLVKMITEFDYQEHQEHGKLKLADLRERRLVRPMFLHVYNRAREYQLLREKSSNLYTKSKIMFRYYFLAIGRNFVHNGLLTAADDIFYLTPTQVESAISGKLKSDDLIQIVEEHKNNMEHYKDLDLPTVIYGETPPPVCFENTKIFLGVPASVGSYIGKSCVVKNKDDFPKLKKGEVLIIPYSDVSWAPLFAQAGALISASGGLLSHGSIVAREYGIPAIVSVENAMRIPDGHMVIVDAHKGVVYVQEDT